MKLIRIKIFIIGMILASCSLLRKPPDKSYEEKSVESVDVAVPLDKTLPEISDQSTSYGPEQTEKSLKFEKRKTNRKRVLGLFFSSAMMRSLSYIGFLKAFEEFDQDVAVLSGSEWGGVLAALYSLGENPSQLEWRFFQMFSEVAKEHSWNSTQMEEAREKYFLEILKGKKIQSANQLLVLMNYNFKQKKLEHFTRGDLYTRIKNDLITSERSFLTTSVGRGALRAEVYQKLGVEKLICVAAPGESVTMNYPDGHIEGLFSKEFAFLKRSSCDLNIHFDFHPWPMDGRELDREILKKSYEISREKLSKWFKSLEQKPKIKKI